MTDPRLPLPGPLHTPPTIPDQATAVLHLDIALTRIVLGDYDRQAACNVTALDRATVAAVASWLRRSFDAGLSAGRAERVDETERVQRLEAEVAQMHEELRRLRDQVGDLMDGKS